MKYEKAIITENTTKEELVAYLNKAEEYIDKTAPADNRFSKGEAVWLRVIQHDLLYRENEADWQSRKRTFLVSATISRVFQNKKGCSYLLNKPFNKYGRFHEENLFKSPEEFDEKHNGTVITVVPEGQHIFFDTVPFR